jgi:hypothetical protein
VYTRAQVGQTVSQFWLENNVNTALGYYFLDDIQFVQLPVGKDFVLKKEVICISGYEGGVDNSTVWSDSTGLPDIPSTVISQCNRLEQFLGLLLSSVFVVLFLRWD